MTTWDLFRLLRNKESLGWPNEVVTPIFYRSGRIEPVPEHYLPIGRIEGAWEYAFGVIPIHPIAIGATLAVEVDDRFEELEVTSIHVHDESVQSAPAGSDCGIGCDGASKRFRKGNRVFLLQP
jgi:hypothetical protein